MVKHVGTQKYKEGEERKILKMEKIRNIILNHKIF